MLKFSLYSYLPQRFIRKTTFEQMDISRMIIGFKDGRNVYSRWAAVEFAHALCLMNLSGVTIVCVPASTKCANVRRWKLFSQLLCKYTGATNGFEHIEVIGNRQKAHVTHEYELASNIKHCIKIDADFFHGRKVLVIDDVYTTGNSSSAFIGAMKGVGANVVMAGFLAKTKRFRV